MLIVGYHVGGCRSRQQRGGKKISFGKLSNNQTILVETIFGAIFKPGSQFTKFSFFLFFLFVWYFYSFFLLLIYEDIFFLFSSFVGRYFAFNFPVIQKKWYRNKISFDSVELMFVTFCLFRKHETSFKLEIRKDPFFKFWNQKGCFPISVLYCCWRREDFQFYTPEQKCFDFKPKIFFCDKLFLCVNCV